MTTNINYKELKQLLLEIHTDFIVDPNNKQVQKKAIMYDSKYGALTAYNNIFSSFSIPKQIVNAIGNLPLMYQYGTGIFDDKETLRLVKEIIKTLKEFKP